MYLLSFLLLAQSCPTLCDPMDYSLLLLLNHFSRVRLCVTPEMAAHQAPPSLGFSRQETGVGCHFLLQCIQVKSQSEATQSCPTLSDPMDCSLPCSSVHGIFQARVLEWGAIAFSGVSCTAGRFFTTESPGMPMLSLSMAKIFSRRNVQK